MELMRQTTPELPRGGPAARAALTQGVDEAGAPAAKPRTPVVLALLAATAATFSYLGAYALTDALVAAEVMAPWPREADPRPRWMLNGFASLMGLFLFLAGLVRHLSRRHLARMERMAD